MTDITNAQRRDACKRLMDALDAAARDGPRIPAVLVVEALRSLADGLEAQMLGHAPLGSPIELWPGIDPTA